MNISYPPFHITNVPPEFSRLGHDSIKATAFFLIPFETFYFSVYFHNKGWKGLYEALSLLSLGMLWASPVVAPVGCGAARSLQNFGSEWLFFFSCPW